MADRAIKNLFIDANVWLSLFHFSSDDLEQFSKLQALIGTDIVLYIPEQISHEVYRNRENKIKDALDKLIFAMKHQPIKIMDYPYKLTIKWEHYEE